MNRRNSKLIDAVAVLIKKQFQAKKYKSKEKIYVMHIDTDVASLYIGDDIVAKKVQNEKNLDVVAVSLLENEEVKKIDEAFGFQVNNFLDRPCKTVRVYLVALFVMLFQKKDILGLKYRGVRIGDALYDELIVRYSIKEVGFTCKSLDWKIGFPLLIKFFNAIENMEREFKKFPPKYLVIHEINCYRGLMGGVAEYYGADIILVRPPYGKFLPVLSADVRRSYKLRFHYIYYSMVKEGMKKGYSYWKNKYGGSMFLFRREENMAKEKSQLLKELGINNNKKNIFILPHCLSDCAREVAISMYFRDYEEWLVETLSYIKNIKDVNWIIKDHPLSKLYAQEKYIKRLYDIHKSDNVFWMDKKYDGETVKSMADAVVTCAGDAGCEYVANGIPTITSAITAYSCVGISNAARNKEEYFRLLKIAGHLNPVSEEEKRKAMCYISIINSVGSSECDINEYTQLSQAQRNKIWGKSRVKLDKSNEDFLLEFHRLLQEIPLDRLEWSFSSSLK